MHDYFTRHGVWVEETHSKKVTLFDRHSPAVQALQASWKSLTGRGDPPYVTGGGTYSCAFPNAITYGIIGGGFGKCEESILPGRGSAHEKDEYVHASIMTNGLIAYVAALRALDETI